MADRAVEVLPQVGLHLVVVEQGVVDVEEDHRPRGHVEASLAGFSWWPPNWNRIADRIRFANSPSPRLENRS